MMQFVRAAPCALLLVVLGLLSGPTAGHAQEATSPYNFPYGYPFPDYPVAGASHPSQSGDYTAEVSVEGLEPSTEYHYEILLGAEQRPVAAEHQQFRTHPRQHQSGQFRIAFGGGAGYVPHNERTWDTIDRFDPRASLPFPTSRVSCHGPLQPVFSSGEFVPELASCPPPCALRNGRRGTPSSLGPSRQQRPGRDGPHSRLASG